MLYELWLYEPRLEHVKVVGYTGGNPANPDRIARVLAVSKEHFYKLKKECELSNEAMTKRHDEAKRLELNTDELQYWNRCPLRRCPCCLYASPSRCVMCLHFRASSLCQKTLLEEAPTEKATEG